MSYGNINKTLDVRERTHGYYPEQAQLADEIRKLFYTSKNWAVMTPVEHDAALMVAVKMSRILNGNPHEPDHWHDISGYSSLVVEDLTRAYIDGVDYGIK